MPRLILRFLLTWLTLTAIWFLLSGKADAMHLGIGIAGAAVISAVFFPWRRGGHRFPILHFLLFVPWAMWQILISNLRVARLVLTPSLPIRPRFIRMEPGVEGERPLTMLGCAITLTPGTLTVDADSDRILVHALDGASAEGVESGLMSRRVGRVFGQGGRR